MIMDARPCCAPGGSGEEARPIELTLAEQAGAGMVRIAAGAFLMGCDRDEGRAGDGEGPQREVWLDEFWISATAVTNREFRQFVEATGYQTDAERFGWSYVFWLAIRQEARRFIMPGRVAAAPWWRGVQGACWHQPEGPGSDIAARPDHPVVHVSWNDAQALAQWQAMRLPSEAEWEKAARGGLVGQRFPWGDELLPAGQHRCNIWQGEFPHHNSAEDDYLITAPVKSFLPNDYGLWNMVGNVWEWTSDRWSADWHAGTEAALRNNPQGPPDGIERVIKGGSYLCHQSWCNRYRNAARSFNNPDASTAHMGVRLAWSPPAGSARPTGQGRGCCCG